MENELFNRLMKKHDGELVLTTENITKKSTEFPLLYHKFLKAFSIELKLFKKITREKSELYGELYKHYKFSDDHTWSNKHEIESQIFNNDSYKIKKREYDEQEVQVQQLESVLDNIKRTSYTVRNIVDYERFKMTGL